MFLKIKFRYYLLYYNDLLNLDDNTTHVNSYRINDTSIIKVGEYR